MAILVTGGAGFIGANFVLEWLTHSDEPVINLDKLTYAGNLQNLASLKDDDRHRFVVGGIENGAIVGELLRQYRVRAIVNFAAESHVDRSISGPGAFIDTNVVGTFHLLEAARHWWGDLSGKQKADFRFLHISTDEVYGALDKAEGAFTEQRPYRPSSPYAASKAASDHLVRSYGATYDLPVLITNCSNNYGPLQFPEKLIPLTIHRALAGSTLPVYGDGLQIRDWLYVSDHCSAIRRVLDAAKPGTTYNIGGNSERTNIEVVRLICRLLDQYRPNVDGRSYADQIAFVTDRPGHDRRYAIDATKLRSDLGWVPDESFESGLARTVQWNLDHSEWLDAVTSGTYRSWAEKQYA